MTRPKMDSVRTCAKCGAGQANDPIGAVRRPVAYRHQGSDMKTMAGSVVYVHEDEWLERTCVRCGYTWNEACIDA